MEQIVTELRAEWQSLWQKTGAVGDPEIPFTRIMNHHLEPGRFYHGPRHIKSCLDELKPVRNLAQNPDAVEYALWMHDEIYDPAADNNEEESARLSKETLTQAMLPASLVDKIYCLIIHTKDHLPSDSIDEQLASGIDLSILGAPPLIYDQYKDEVRQEYSQVPLYLYRRGRGGVLQKFLDRLREGNLFQVLHFKQKLAVNAEYNLANEIEELESMKVAIYAGSFDPPTNGHYYIIEKASKLFDNLVVAIGQNPEKRPGRFPPEERLQMLREMTSTMPNVDITSYPVSYLITFAKSIDAGYIVRGLRNERDWQAESDLDEFNFGVDPKIATVFLRTPDRLSRVSSSFVMGLIGYEGWEEEVKARVPESVYRKIVASKFSN